jgi:hypothetical protein
MSTRMSRQSRFAERATPGQGQHRMSGMIGWSTMKIARLCTLGAVAAGLAGSSLAATTAQRTCPTPSGCVDALVQAVKARDRAAALAILGPSSAQDITSGDPVADKDAWTRFVGAYEQKHTVTAEGDARATLTIGPDDWPFAFPLVKGDAGWHFDTEAGIDEMQARRVGANELAAIKVMLAIADAQRDYTSQDHNRDGVREYARRFASTNGKRDGLYWPTAAGEAPSPLGPLVTRAAGEGYGGGKMEAKPYHGYYFRLLTKQGSNARGGALDYVVHGRMIGGFAAIAYPARYASSGVMTFIINYDGVVYEKDLGPKTAELARAVTSFDPGTGWKPAPNQ